MHLSSNAHFLVMAHADPVMLARLTDRLAPFPAIVHIDRRVSIEPFLHAVGRRKHVRFLPDTARVPICWGGFSHVLAMRSLLGAALEGASDEDYFVFLSGACYPLRPVGEVAGFLAANSPREHIRFTLIDSCDDPYCSKRVDRRHYRDLTVLPQRTPQLVRANNLVRKTLSWLMSPFDPGGFPGGLRPAFGSDWFAITGACARFVLDASSAALDERFSTTFCPSEMYVHTLVANSEFASRTPAGGAEPFQGRGLFRLANLHHIHPSLSTWYAESDIAEIAASEKFFVRKVSTSTSTTLLDWIDENRLGR